MNDFLSCVIFCCQNEQLMAETVMWSPTKVHAMALSPPVSNLKPELRDCS